MFIKNILKYVLIIYKCFIDNCRKYVKRTRARLKIEAMPSCNLLESVVNKISREEQMKQSLSIAKRTKRRLLRQEER